MAAPLQCQIEAFQTARAAFYQVDGKNRCLRPINVANGMPEVYQRAVNGFRIGPRSLACELAVYTGQPVITPDVGLNPAWQPWRAMAEQFDYRGCWSFPLSILPRASRWAPSPCITRHHE